MPSFDPIAYNMALAHVESGGNSGARGVSEGMIAPAAGKYQLTASTAKGLVDKYRQDFPGLSGRSGKEILDIVARNPALQEDLQKTLIKDQSSTILRLGGNPNDPNAHALLHRFGTKATREYIGGSLRGDVPRTEDKAFSETPNSYLAKLQRAGLPGARTVEAPQRLQQAQPTSVAGPLGVGGMAPPRIEAPQPSFNYQTAMGPSRQEFDLTPRQRRKMEKLERKLSDESWVDRRPKKAARAERKLARLQTGEPGFGGWFQSLRRV